MMSVDESFFSRPVSTIEPSVLGDSMKRTESEISDDSPLQQILDTGRFHKKFDHIVKIGEGGFG